jgi:hypothetical protein
VPIHQNKQVVSFSIYTRCLQPQPVVILVTSQKLQSSETFNNNICKRLVKPYELNLVSHAATKQNAQNTFTTVQRDEAKPACAPQLSGPHEITIQVIMSNWARMGALYARTRGSFPLVHLF